MATFKNISPLGDLAVPVLGQDVLAGATVEVTDEKVAADFRLQPETWQEVSGEVKAADASNSASTTTEAPAPAPAPAPATTDAPVDAPAAAPAQ